MRRNPASGVLGFVIGAALGALIGLALIKVVSPWCIPIGAAIGGFIGLALGSSGGRSRPAYSDDESGTEAAAETGCMLLGCLGDGLSCFGVLALLVAGIGAGIFIIAR